MDESRGRREEQKLMAELRRTERASSAEQDEVDPAQEIAGKGPHGRTCGGSGSRIASRGDCPTALRDACDADLNRIGTDRGSALQGSGMAPRSLALAARRRRAVPARHRGRIGSDSGMKEHASSKRRSSAPAPRKRPTTASGILLDLGTSRGFLTYEELNEKLPDEVVSPDKLDSLLMMIDEMGIKLIDEADIGEYVRSSPASARSPAPTKTPRKSPRRRRRRRGDRPQPRGRAGRGVDQAHRRPGPHVPHPDGRDPPAHPRAGNRAGQEDRDHPQDLPLARCSNPTTASRRRSRSSSRSTTATCRSTAR